MHETSFRFGKRCSFPNRNDATYMESRDFPCIFGVPSFRQTGMMLHRWRIVIVGSRVVCGRGRPLRRTMPMTAEKMARLSTQTATQSLRKIPFPLCVRYQNWNAGSRLPLRRQIRCPKLFPICIRSFRGLLKGCHSPGSGRTIPTISFYPWSQ